MKLIIFTLIVWGFGLNQVKTENAKNARKKSSFVHFIMYGQSLSVGHQSYPAISTENVYGNFMLGNQIWINYGNNKMVDISPLEGTIAESFRFQEDIMNRSAGTIAECPLIGAVNHIQLKKPGDLIIATSCGTSGTTIEELSKESQTQNLYDDFLQAIQEAFLVAQKRDQMIICPAIFWMQGEWNYQGYKEGLVQGSKPTAEKDEYKELLINLKNNMQNDIRLQYSQEQSPLFITYQVGAQYIKGREQTIGMAQLESANENDDIVMAGPVYPMTDRGGHLDPNGYRWFGEMLGKVYYYTNILGQNFKPLQPIKISRKQSNHIIEIEFHVPYPPLVIDNLTLKAVEAYGFEIYENNVRKDINAITISGNCVYLHMQTALNGSLEVSYAGETTAGHGNLRDSDPYHSFYNYINLDRKRNDGTYVYPRTISETTLRPLDEPRDERGNVIYNQPYPLYNFCVSFYYRLNRDEQSISVPGFNIETSTDKIETVEGKQLTVSQFGDILYVNCDFKWKDKLAVEIYDIYGNRIRYFTEIKQLGLVRRQYELKSLKRGLYFTKVEVGGLKEVAKIIIY